MSPLTCHVRQIVRHRLIRGYWGTEVMTWCHRCSTCRAVDSLEKIVGDDGEQGGVASRTGDEIADGAQDGVHVGGVRRTVPAGSGLCAKEVSQRGVVELADGEWSNVHSGDGELR